MRVLGFTVDFVEGFFAEEVPADDDLDVGFGTVNVAFDADAVIAFVLPILGFLTFFPRFLSSSSLLG
jgi:hypothetical protein